MGVSQPYKELGNATDMYSITGLHLPTKEAVCPRWVNGNPRRCLFVLHGVHANGGTRRKRSRWGFGVRPIVHQAIARSSYFICCSAIFLFCGQHLPLPCFAREEESNPLQISMPLELKSSPSTNPTHPGQP